MLTQQCYKCGKVKPISEFHSDTRSRTGIVRTCKECISTYARQYHAAHQYSPTAIKTKKCSRCKLVKPISEFAISKYNKLGYASQCKKCYNAAHKVFSKEHPTHNSEAQVKSRYGMTYAEHQLLDKSQNGICAICGCPETRVNRLGQIVPLTVDHDHKTGRVRALLCFHCNWGIGHFYDDPELLEKAAEYLRKHQDVKEPDCLA
jgi:hypothetical protein